MNMILLAGFLALIVSIGMQTNTQKRENHIKQDGESVGI